MGRQLPIGTDARRYVQRNGHGDGMLHGILHQRGGLLLLTVRDLHHKLIMNLQYEATSKVRFLQCVIRTMQCDFNDVRRRALDRRVQRGAFGRVPHGTVRRFETGEIPAPSENGFGISFFACGRDKRFKVFMDFAKSGEILVFQRFGFFGLDLELLGKSIRAETEGKSIADRLDEVMSSTGMP